MYPFRPGLKFLKIYPLNSNLHDDYEIFMLVVMTYISLSTKLHVDFVFVQKKKNFV